jgi:hypothetical protein
MPAAARPSFALFPYVRSCSAQARAQGCFQPPQKTTAFRFTKLGPPPAQSLALNQWLGRTSANPNDPAAAEFFIKVTCFAKANMRGSKMEKKPLVTFRTSKEPQTHFRSSRNSTPE